MTTRTVLAAAAALACVTAGTARAQHPEHAHPDVTAEAPAGPHDAPHPGVLGIPMTRRGSGTAWLPDASPMRGALVRVGGWDVMIHGNLFAGVSAQGSEAGETELASQHWVMAMASRPAAGGVVEGRAMVSLEPLVLGRDGYPLLLQTGETAFGEPLVDRQHPHDLWMELAVRFARELGRGVAIEAYGALAGEPALGPVAYPHRPSAMADPAAPLGHHWQDATHIAFGVLTAGVFTRTVKLEASWFNGREPDEARFDLDLRAPDSYAVRLSVNPTATWSLQASYARLASPETLEPEVSVARFTASAIHARPLRAGRSFTAAAVIGVNAPSEGPATESLHLEAALDLGRAGVTFARAERVAKTGHDFGLHGPMEHAELPVASIAVGHVHPIAELGGVELGVGARGAIGWVDDALVARYGTRTPVGAMVYLQLQPTPMAHAGHAAP